MRITFFLLPIITSLSTVLWADEPTLKMHIFKESTVAEKQGKDLKMIIFDHNKNTRKLISQHSELTTVTDEIPIAKEKFRYWSGGINTGYQHEQLKWQVASTDGLINPFLIENWHSVDLWTINADLGFQLPSGWLVQGHGEYGFAFNGGLERNGYFSNANSTPDFQTNSTVDAGNAIKFSGSLGYTFKLGEQNHWFFTNVTPLFGYAYQEQHYSAISGIDNFRVKNTYTSAWQGPWAGLKLAFIIHKKHELLTNIEIHWANFKALGELSNSSGLQKIEHIASAIGYKASFGYQFKPKAYWGINLMFNYQHWETQEGSEILNLPSGSSIRSPLKSVVRDAFGINAGVNVNF